MAESQQRHIQKMDERAFELTAAERRRGQWLGLAAAIAAFATVGICAFFKAYTAAGIVGGTTTLGIVSIFVIGRLVQPGTEDEEEGSREDRHGQRVRARVAKQESGQDGDNISKSAE